MRFCKGLLGPWYVWDSLLVRYAFYTKSRVRGLRHLVSIFTLCLSAGVCSWEVLTRV